MRCLQGTATGKVAAFPKRGNQLRVFSGSFLESFNMCSRQHFLHRPSFNRGVGRQLAQALGAFMLAAICSVASQADGEPIKVEGEAPPDHAVLKHVRGGAYFVAKDLKERYDALLARVRGLEAAVAADQIKGSDALSELRELEPKLNELRKEIEAKKVLVSPVKIQTRNDEFAFDLGPERLLVITADRVRVVGWDKPQVKCLLKKSILATGAQPENEEFNALRVVHRRSTAPEFVGRTDAENTAEEEKFQNSDAGRKLSDAQQKRGASC